MIRVVVRDQRGGDPVAVRLGDVQQTADIPGGIHDDRLALHGITDQVHEIRHLPGGRLMARDLLSGQELAEVKRGCGHPSKSVP